MRVCTVCLVNRGFDATAVFMQKTKTLLKLFGNETSVLGYIFYSVNVKDIGICVSIRICAK